jgi:hypothetical protein
LIQLTTSTDGEDTRSFTSQYSMSDNGKFLAFSSGGRDFKPTTTGFIRYEAFLVFVKDVDSGAVELISRSNGTHRAALANCILPSISGDGRFIAFETKDREMSYDDGTKLYSDTNGFSDIYLFDRTNHEIRRISLGPNATEGNADSFMGSNSAPNQLSSISDDGRYVVFESLASNLVEDDTNELRDVFVHDTTTGETRRASVAADGSQGVDLLGGSSGSDHGNISGDGRYVTFRSSLDFLQGGETTGLASHIYRAPNPFLESVPYVRPDPANNFLWTGNAGDDDWHKAGNWKFKTTEDVVTEAPGDPTLGPNQNIEIDGATVKISAPVYLKSIHSTGSLTVSSALSIEAESEIENIHVDADLTLKNKLTITGSSNTLISGEINLPDDNSSIQNMGTLTVSEGATLKSGLNGPGYTHKFFNNANSTLRFMGEDSIGISADWTVINAGMIEGMWGYIKVNAEVDQTAGGRLYAHSSATLDFTRNVEIKETSKIQGLGRVIFSGASLLVSQGAQLQNTMDSFQEQGVLFTNGITLSGDGIFASAGNTDFEDATLDGLKTSVLKNADTTFDFLAPSDNLNAIRHINSLVLNQSIINNTGDIISLFQKYNLRGMIHPIPELYTLLDFPKHHCNQASKVSFCIQLKLRLMLFPYSND